MTDKAPSFVRLERVEGIPRGRFTVTADCDEDAIFVFHLYNEDSGRFIRRTNVPRGAFNDGNQPLNSGQPGQSCAQLNVRVGDALPQSYYSSYCDDDSQVSVAFLGPGYGRQIANKEDTAIRSIYSAMFPNGGGEGIEAFSQLVTGMTQISGIAVEKLNLDYQDVIEGKPLRIEVPFRDGSTSTIRLDLQDSVFRDFTNSCSAGIKRTPLENAMGGALPGGVWSDSVTELPGKGKMVPSR